MDLEDKLVDDRELAQVELLQRSDRDEQGEQTLPAPEAEVVADVSQDQRYQLLHALRVVLAGQTLHVDQLHLPEREAVALEALQVAVSGASRLGTFVYASDRRDMLEQALAVLQPDLGYQNDPAARELYAELIGLSDRVAELRHQLTQLEDSEDELLSDYEKAQLEAAAAPTDDAKPGQPSAKPGQPASTKPGQGASAKPAKPTAAKPAAARPNQLASPDLAAGDKAGSNSQTPTGDPDAPRPTTLTGPDLPDEPPQPTTLTGPGSGGPGSIDQPAAPAATTLVGPDLPDERPQPTTLIGSGPGGPGSVDQPAAPAPTTLVGPDLPAEPQPPSMLDGDGPLPDSGPGDDRSKKSWWRRPFG